jgi:hypothetical protein
MDHGWRKLILFTFIVLMPATVVGISNFFVFPDSALSATIMLIVTVGVAAIFTWQSGNATRKIARYCICADILICIILCINLGGHWLLAREVSAAKQGVEERDAEKDKDLQRKKTETELEIKLKEADAALLKQQTAASNAESRRLDKLPFEQRRSSPRAQPGKPKEAVPAPTAPPEPEATPAPKAAAPRLTPDQVREKWRGFLTALAFAEIFASVLAGAILAGIWEWDRDRDGVADHKQLKTQHTPGFVQPVEAAACASKERGEADPK